MNFDEVNNKQLMDIERLAKELQDALRKAHLGGEPFYKDLTKLIEETETTRRARFDMTDNGYKGF
ncbi:MAG: hypothetical protein J0L63_17550 [Anaerolineae bacterium]|nr:hypothetical protein [Anaerolineae bacterium]MBN8620724.1 hypothetical protein [Anaerolineae bacterium]